MYCTKCGIELREADRFCSQCGSRTAAYVAATTPRVLMLDKRNKKIAGVCAGFARYFELDVVLVRVLWLAAALCSGGLGFIAYLAAWIVIPNDAGVEIREPVAHATQTT